MFFGANDAALPSDAGSQHIPLAAYRQNLADILGHPAVKLQNPRIVLITPPPVDEYQLGEMESGKRARSRTAEHTKLYADTARELGASEGVVVLDFWSELMQRAGWQPGQPLIGSKAGDKNPQLGSFLTDGMEKSTGDVDLLRPAGLLVSFHAPSRPLIMMPNMLSRACRSPSHPQSLQGLIPMSDADDRRALAG